MKILTQGDNNPHWHIPMNCTQCNQKGIKYIKLHKILECNRHKEKRAHIFDSILTELDNLKKNFHGSTHINKQVIPRKQYNTILDASVTGRIHTHQLQQHTLTTLLGGNVDKTLNDKAQQQVAKTMMAHLYLLTNIFTNNIQIAKKWKELPNGEKVAQEELKQGKVVVRAQKDGKTYYQNIRNTIEELEIHQLLQYNIGMGTASTRTNKQKELARRYTDTMVNNATDNIIMVDGSMNTIDNPKPQKQQKIEQSGYGGIGGIWINKNTKQVKGYFKNTINTNDAQIAEIQGMNTAIEIINKTNIKDVTILCDCKNAVKYSNKIYKAPKKYAEQMQQIYTKLTESSRKKKNINVEWIPGHTGNEWNDLADKIAKAATKDWTKPNTSTGLMATLLPFVRALDVKDVRLSPPKRGTG